MFSLRNVATRKDAAAAPLRSLGRGGLARNPVPGQRGGTQHRIFSHRGRRIEMHDHSYRLTREKGERLLVRVVQGVADVRGRDLFPAEPASVQSLKRPRSSLDRIKTDVDLALFRSLRLESVVCAPLRTREEKERTRLGRLLLDVNVEHLAVLFLALGLDIVCEFEVPIALSLLCGVERVLEQNVAREILRNVRPVPVSKSLLSAHALVRKHRVSRFGNSHGCRRELQWTVGPRELGHQVGARVRIKLASCAKESWSEHTHA